MWWDSVFRIVCGNSVGSGTFITPEIILSAAHVLVPDPRNPPPFDITSSILVIQMLGYFNQYNAIKSVICQEWLDEKYNADLFDMCLIRVVPVNGLGLNTVYDFKTPSGSEQVKVHGFEVGHNSSSTGIPIQGSITRSGDGFLSNNICAGHGFSGGPILVPAQGNAPKSVVGILTDAPKVVGNTVNIGLPLLDSNFGKLLPII